MSEKDHPSTASDQKTYMELIREKREAHLKKYRDSQIVKNTSLNLSSPTFSIDFKKKNYTEQKKEKHDRNIQQLQENNKNKSQQDQEQKTYMENIRDKREAHLKQYRDSQSEKNTISKFSSSTSACDSDEKTYVELKKEKYERHLQNFLENKRVKAEKEQEEIRLKAENAEEQIRLIEEQKRLIEEQKRRKAERRNEAFEKILRIHDDQELSLSFDQFRTEYPKLSIISSSEDDCRIMWNNLNLFISWYQPDQVCYASAFTSILQRHTETQRQQAEVQRRNERIEATIKSSTEKHALTLQAKRRQLVYKNDYGVVKGEDKWHRELEDFITDMLRLADVSLFGVNIQAIIQSINEILDDRAVVPQDSAEITEMTGTEFEIYCANVLESTGWEVIRNGKTGDQGVDLIASKYSNRVALQCKRYTGAVSNKAVQEVFSGMNYYKCSRGIVVSNASFTASAIRLARTNDILLIDPESLKDLDNLL